MSFPLNKANVYFLLSLIVLPLAGTYKKLLYILAIKSLEIKKKLYYRRRVALKTINLHVR